MFIQNTNIEGLAVIEPRLHKDARGYFFESLLVGYYTYNIINSQV